ncbi:butyrate kinase [Aquibacillus albus]|uniref:Probable butyrate kinase n=1 Tax=Aquibacillus albus TaxID=1168171 RepID=A0ABS2MVB0_9BACI|nr:butyrate kinase [Aquibacillus albus]MBM7569723.1 butyrate kinase [Aquibacillus albus]
MSNNKRIVVINPGLSYTKIGIFSDEFCIMEQSIDHNMAELTSVMRVMDQYEIRKKDILHALFEIGINHSKVDAVCGRGGLLRPIQGGTYRVNELMLQDLRMGYNGEHVSNLGGILAYEIASEWNVPAFIVDPVVVDELGELARFSGLPEVPRRSIFHALNQKAVARKAAEKLGKAYKDIRLIVAHIGGGITVGAHEKGRVIDVNNGLYGDGPLSPERAGTVPAGDLISMCFSGEFSQDQMMKKVITNGGLKAYLQTDNLKEVEERIQQGDDQAKLVYEVMAYQVSKEIGALSAVLEGEIDAIVLTGNIETGNTFVSMVMNKIKWITDVLIFPGQNDLEALAQGTLRVLRNEEEQKEYVVEEGKEEHEKWPRNMI